METVLAVKHLSKYYGRHQALSRVSFSLSGGELVGLLGPNGAGKTTCLKSIAGLLNPEEGTVEIHGKEKVTRSIDIKRITGYIPENPQFFPYLTGTEHLHVSRSLRKLSKTEYADHEAVLVRRLKMEDAMDRPVASYSHGMKQKLAFILALYHKPRLLLVDEPMVGLDVYAQSTVIQLLEDWKSGGRAVLLSTHTLSLVERVCSHVILLDRGKIITSGEITDLLKDDTLESRFMRLRNGETEENRQDP